MITTDQLKDIKERTEALYRYLDIENKTVQVEEEQLRTQAPGFWDDAKKAEAQMKKVKTLKSRHWQTNWNWHSISIKTNWCRRRKWMKRMPKL